MKRSIAVLNGAGKVIGAQNEKEAHRMGLWHASAHVWIYTAKGEVLFQKRALSKIVYPGLLDISAAGHVLPGEDPREAAIRETREELGVSLGSRHLQFAGRGKVNEVLKKLHWPNKEFYYLFFYKISEQNTLTFVMNHYEVRSLKFIPVAELRHELMEKKSRTCYVPHGMGYYSRVISWVRSHARA